MPWIELWVAAPESYRGSEMYSMQHNREHVEERGSRETPSRVVMDAHGNEWVDHEVDTPQPWAHGAHCLIFSCPAIVRRVWRYPDAWARLTSRELLALLDDPTLA